MDLSKMEIANKIAQLKEKKDEQNKIAALIEYEGLEVFNLTENQEKKINKYVKSRLEKESLDFEGVGFTVNAIALVISVMIAFVYVEETVIKQFKLFYLINLPVITLTHVLFKDDNKKRKQLKLSSQARFIHEHILPKQN